MATFLVLADCLSRGPSGPNQHAAGDLVDDDEVPVTAMLDQGCPLLSYNPGTMATSRDAFLKQPKVLRQSGLLVAMLVARGVVT